MPEHTQTVSPWNSPLASRAARLLEVALGAFFLFAAYLKFKDANAFVPLMHVYVYGTPFDDPTLKGIAALVTIFLETALGIGMLIGLRLRFLVLGLTLGMLLFFSVIVAIVWPEDCGCLPGFKMGPVSTIAKNVLTGTAVLAVMAALYKSSGGLPRDKAFAPKLAAMLLLGFGAAAYSYPQIFTPAPAPVPAAAVQASPAPVDASPATAAPTPTPAPADTAGPFSRFEITSELTGETYKLAQGEYLVAALSMTCEHCMASVPALNQLMIPDFPPLVALGNEPAPGDLDTFKMTTQAMFPIYNLGPNFLEFSQFIGQSPPRLYFVIDGHSAMFWDWKEEMPSEQEIRSGIEEARAKHAANAG